ncbi:MAG: HAD family hydrolase [Alphaproteobacteria bacterium]|nr:HAD family hydrolase [Alphaproteobacteria bacterium]
MQKPDAVIFDWDDTIVDTWQVVRSAINTTLEAFGHTPWSEDEARKRIGPPARVLFSGLFGEDKWQDADKIYIDAYKKHITAHIRLHDGARETLEALKAVGIPMAVVSTKRGALLRTEAAQLGLDGFFIRLVGAGDAPVDKPDAAAVYFALQDMQITPSKNVLFIGDSATDMMTAANAGCTGILIETKPPAEETLAAHPPQYRIKDHAQLVDFLKKYTGTKPSCPAAPPGP